MRKVLDVTRDQLVAAATAAHDEQGCGCDRRYLMSCPKFAAAILSLGKQAPAAEERPVEVVELSGTEWQEAAERGLARVGLTFDELAAQATRHRFSSMDALKLWYAIGGAYRRKEPT